MYLVFAISAGVIGGILSILMRMELQFPGQQIFANAHIFNVVVTAHGLIMIFFTLMPALMGGFGNWMVPLMIGAIITCAIADHLAIWTPLAVLLMLGAQITLRAQEPT